MPEQMATTNLWKKIFFALAILIVVIMPFVSKDYGMTGDEWLQIEYGEDIWNYFANDNQQALSYDNKSMQYQGIEYYGGLFDYSMAILHHTFPTIDVLTLRHFFNALMGAVMMVFVGLIAFRISKKWQVGFLALLFVLFSPRLFGESMNNPKDIPFACGFVITMYGLLAYLQDFPARRLKNILMLGLGFTISFGVRPAGGLLLVAYIGFFSILYYLLNETFRKTVQANNNKLFKTLVLQVIVALAAGYFIGLLAWPWGLQEPLTNPFVSLEKMTHIAIQIRVLFDGKYSMNNQMPWFYEFKWILISNPIIVLVGVALFFLLLLQGKKQYGSFAIVMVLFCAFFPILYMIYKHSSVHDTWRHVFFVYTFWVIMAALGFDLVAGFIKNEKLKLIPFYIAIAGLLPAVWWTVRTHPNQYVYFNEFIGGPKGAFGYFDIDYYQNSGKQAAHWIKKNAKPVPGKKIIVMSNLSAYYKYFEKDTSWITAPYGRYGDRHHLDWDYYVTYPRYVSAELMQNDKWPPRNTLHTISIDGAPLSVIFKNKSKAGIAAFEAYEKKDYVTAAELYKQFIAADNSDELAYINYSISLAYTGQVNDAIAAANQAIELNPFAPQYYELLAQLYAVNKDEANARVAAAKANELKYNMEEE